MALDALSKYSMAISSRKINLDIQVQAERQNLNYQIQNDDRLKTKKISLKATKNEINVRIRGEGCLLVQVRFFCTITSRIISIGIPVCSLLLFEKRTEERGF